MRVCGLVEWTEDLTLCQLIDNFAKDENNTSHHHDFPDDPDWFESRMFKQPKESEPLVIAARLSDNTTAQATLYKVLCLYDYLSLRPSRSESDCGPETVRLESQNKSPTLYFHGGGGTVTSGDIDLIWKRRKKTHHVSSEAKNASACGEARDMRTWVNL
ncbi:hypothetical protein K432DRAFT_398229 [Lepidopterella palustris CBS 459.81]|uniref:Uncharacterized protein n=1 Tax=Lepidopterella palustris CBS 459.81 TaxID=1314670 RepID=A0A8E2DYT7_9PEZI|nr:hypothetical protein K432DRAFT_398229 [Lepidopterella palustris CBS 459.81]